MITLSERLMKIANYIEDGEDVADIGTDHGYLPLYLLEQNHNRKVIFTDLNEGPITKTKNIIINEYPKANISSYDIRIGNGLEPLKTAEVSTVVIAGMGGILIRDILSDNDAKTRSFSKLILQPRTASDKLRYWLIQNGFYITDEALAYEKGRTCEILVVSTASEPINNQFIDNIDYELSPILLGKEDKIVDDWLNKLIEVENNIKNSISMNGSNESKEKLEVVEKRLKKLKSIKKNRNKIY